MYGITRPKSRRLLCRTPCTVVTCADRAIPMPPQLRKAGFHDNDAFGVKLTFRHISDRASTVSQSSPLATRQTCLGVSRHRLAWLFETNVGMGRTCNSSNSNSNIPIRTSAKYNEVQSLKTKTSFPLPFGVHIGHCFLPRVGHEVRDRSC